MTDLEINEKCAYAMGLHAEIWPAGDRANPEQMESPDCYLFENGKPVGVYDPLHNDAQAMALVKEMRLQIETVEVGWWIVSTDEYSQRHGDMFVGDGMDLNRAICECVAKKMAAE